MKYPSTNIGLIDCLKDKVEEIVENFQLKCNVGDKEKAPKVSTQYLPEKRKPSRQQIEEDPDFPHVIIRFMNEKDKTGETIVEMHIIVGTVSDDPVVGCRDVLNVLNRIKLELKKQRAIASFRMVENSYQTIFEEEQVIPEWIGYSIVQYTIPPIVDEGSLEFV